MGVTGLIGIGFVIVHMAGNLQAFIGPAKLNAYGAALHGPLNELLWLLRIVLIVAVVLHVTMAYQLTRMSAAARPIGYQQRAPQVVHARGANDEMGRRAAARLHRRAHLLHFTTETIDPGGWRGMTDTRGNRDVYGNIVASFRIWWVAAFYIVVDDRARPASLPRRVELGANAWLRQAGGTSAQAADRARRGGHRVGGVHARSGRRARRDSAMTAELKAKVPSGPLEKKWEKHRFEMKLVNPANKRKYTVIMVGSGLAGASAAASLSELGYHVKCFCYQDSPRRAHSIAAQGGINAAKNYQNDGDSIYRLFYDTIKGGDFRSREANVYRLAEVSVNIIDQCAAQGVPFAREYGGLLANRSFGGAQVSRTFYARGQTGQQLLLGAYQALEKEIAKGGVTMYRASRDARPGRRRRTRARHRGARHGHRRHRDASRRRRRPRHRRLRQRLLSLDERQRLQRHGDLAGVQARRRVRESVLHADPSDLHSGGRRASVEAHADERVAAQRRPRVGAEAEGGLPEAAERDRRRRTATTISSESIRASATSRRATSRRAPRKRCATKDAASGLAAAASISTSPTRSSASARQDSRAVRQSLRDVRAHHGRESVRGADAHLSRRALHHGRALGGLQPDEHHSGAARRSAKRTSPTTARIASAPAR